MWCQEINDNCLLTVTSYDLSLCWNAVCSNQVVQCDWCTVKKIVAREPYCPWDQIFLFNMKGHLKDKSLNSMIFEEL